MRVIDLRSGVETATLPRGAAAALGNFDGVHLGHAALIHAARAAADESGAPVAAVTFEQPPRLLRGERGEPCAPPQITSGAEKLRLLASLGADYAVLLDFDAVRDTGAREFVRDILSERLGIDCAICGFNYRFGRGGAGDADALGRYCAEADMRCVAVPPVKVGGRTASSSLIRALLADGDAQGAAELLGRPYTLVAEVRHGFRLGSEIGVPTVNQRFSDGALIPAHGVYVACVDIDGVDIDGETDGSNRDGAAIVGSDIVRSGIDSEKIDGRDNADAAGCAGARYRGVANIGVRPTVSDSGAVNCETHILGYSGDLYGRTVRVSLLRRLRPEMKFASVDELRAQIKRDVAAATL